MSSVISSIQQQIEQTGSTKADRNRLPDPIDAAVFLKARITPVEPIVRGIIDAGTKVGVFGPSKARKSFFGLQLALSLAGGKGEFLKWQIAPKRWRVLVVQLEIMTPFFHDRLRRMAEYLGIDPMVLTGQLYVINGRGWRPAPQAPSFLQGLDPDKLNTPDFGEQLVEVTRKLGVDVILIDPLYKVVGDCDESSPACLREPLRFFDQVCEETGACMIYIHHYGKGVGGDRQTIDRGVGSGIVARDFDAGLFMSEHRDPGLLVVEPIVRNHRPQEPITIEFLEPLGYFAVSEKAPIVRTSQNRSNASGQSKAFTVEDAMDLVTDFIPLKVYDSMLREHTSDRSAQAIRADILGSERLVRLKKPGSGGHGIMYVGPPNKARSQLERWKQQEDNPPYRVDPT
mgnify:CR=1 FL=1